MNLHAAWSGSWCSARLRARLRRWAAAAATPIIAVACNPSHNETASTPNGLPAALSSSNRLPTGARLDPEGPSIPAGNMPLGGLVSHDGRFLVLTLGGWRQQGIQVVDRRMRAVVQTLEQPGAFLGLAWGADGRTLYASGGSSDVVYAYSWREGESRPAAMQDSLVLGSLDAKSRGRRYPAGLALGRDGRSLYVAENLSDSLAVVDLVTRRVIQRVGAGPYPYAVAVASDGHVYVSAWGAGTVSVFRAGSSGRLTAEHPIDVGRHPSALVLNAEGSRLFAVSASTDRIAVVDTRAGRVVRWLLDPPPGGVVEGSTPNALALSPDGTRLFVAEADANAIAVFELSALASGTGTAAGNDSLAGRIPTEWYPTDVVVSGDSLWVVNGKGRGSGPNPTGPQPNVPRAARDPHAYTLGQLDGTVLVLPAAHGAELRALSQRVAAANGWDAPRNTQARYPAFEHVVYIIKENRTFDQVFGDLPQADGDTAFTFFPRAVSPNHHALAERFGIFDRFFVNAEVSNQGHPWSTAGYVTDFIEKTTPDDYRGRRPERDEPGDIDDPIAGYVWDAAQKHGLSLRNYGEYAEPVPRAPGSKGAPTYRALVASLQPYTCPSYPSFDMSVSDQRRADVWLAELRAYERAGQMPALEIVHLPGDHTAGRKPRLATPKACMADNDLALGRMVEALSRTQFWKSTLMLVIEDDSQDGPDHIDSHRSVLLVISAWNRAQVVHRFVNTTDVLATIEEILGLESLSQFDHFGRPLREIWSGSPDLDPYAALTPAQALTDTNVAAGPDVRPSERLDLSRADRVDDDAFNRILWRAIKGSRAPYPTPRRVALQEYVRGR